MTKASAVKRDASFQKIQGLMAEVTREIRDYQEAFANDGFMHSVDEYANSLVGALMTSRGILLAVMGVGEHTAAEEAPLQPEEGGGFIRANLDPVALGDFLHAAPRLRPRP